MAAAQFGNPRPAASSSRQQSPQNERIVADLLNGLENCIKVRRKQLDALHEDALFARKAAEQADAAEGDRCERRRSRRALGDPWRDIEARSPRERAIFEPYTFIEAGARLPGPPGRVRAHAGARRRRARQAQRRALARIHRRIAAAHRAAARRADAHLSGARELRLTNSLERMREWLGPDHPMVRKLLSKESPAELAERVVTRRSSRDPAVRMRVVERRRGGDRRVERSDDRARARHRSRRARRSARHYEDEVEAPIRVAPRSRSRRRGSPRSAPACIRTRRSRCASTAAPCRAGTRTASRVEPFTRLSRAFERATGADPFRIPDSWMQRQGQARHEHAVQPRPPTTTSSAATPAAR